MRPGGAVSGAERQGRRWLYRGFKRGRDKEDDWDRVQLYARPVPFRMLNIPVNRGDIYYLQARRRTHVEFPAQLRESTLRAIARARSFGVGPKRRPRATIRQVRPVTLLSCACPSPWTRAESA